MSTYPVQIAFEIEGTIRGKASRQSRAHYGGAEQRRHQQQGMQPIAMTRPRVEFLGERVQTGFRRGLRHPVAVAETEGR